MTIRRGADWGHAGELRPGAAVAHSDAELGALVEAAPRAPGAAPPEAGLAGGDLFRTLGGRSDRPAQGGGGLRLEVDVVRAVLDGREYRFVAHLVARRRWWRGRVVVAMNAQWLGPWRAGPRAHPGDGLVDITDGALPWRQRLAARRRATTGDHLPHPALRTARVATWSTTFDRPVAVWLDGVRVARARRIELVVEPDALVIVV